MDYAAIFGIVYDTLKRDVLGREIIEIYAVDAGNDFATGISKFLIIPYIHVDIIWLALGHSQ
ncbi:MAG: hypothetical protein A4E45_01193 [Methanosaeta sp. PtaB.Bin039]|nr:MAG: hypothetical protein A4E45_01193 [Methanosaeta sp. PtaB.Bin039]